jgi:hypothetical protein
VVHGLELLPSLCKVDSSCVLIQFTWLHFDEGKILQVETSAWQEVKWNVRGEGVKWNGRGVKWNGRGEGRGEMEWERGGPGVKWNGNG